MKILLYSPLFTVLNWFQWVFFRRILQHVRHKKFTPENILRNNYNKITKSTKCCLPSAKYQQSRKWVLYRENSLPKKKKKLFANFFEEISFQNFLKVYENFKFKMIKFVQFHFLILSSDKRSPSLINRKNLNYYLCEDIYIYFFFTLRRT